MITGKMSYQEIHEKLSSVKTEIYVNREVTKKSVVTKVSKNSKEIIALAKLNKPLVRRTFKTSNDIEYVSLSYVYDDVDCTASREEAAKCIIKHKKTSSKGKCDGIDTIHITCVQYIKWQDVYGKTSYAIMLEQGNDMRMFIFTPHFMSRYRSRMNITNEDISKYTNIMEHYIMNEQIESFVVHSKDINDYIIDKPDLWKQGIYGLKHELDNDIIAATKHGLMMAYDCDKLISVATTFISKEQMNDNKAFISQLLEEQNNPEAIKFHKDCCSMY